MSRRLDDCFGSCTPRFELGVNLEGLWRSCGSESEFVRKFVGVVVHEVLHKEIGLAVWSLYGDGEEDVVDRLSGTGGVVPRSSFWLVWGESL